MTSDLSVSRPRLRIGERGHRQATWAELLYDLVFVVLIAQLAHHLAARLSWSGLIEFALLFIPVWWAWTNEVYYTTRFDSDADKVKRFMATVQLLGLVGMAAAIGQGLEHGAQLWAAAYALIRTVQVLELIRAGRYIPQARSFTSYFVRGHAVGICVWWLSLLLPAQWKPWAWAAGVLIEIATSLSAGTLYQRFPPHVSHLPERFGLFVLLVLGESFTGAARGLMDSTANVTSLTLTALSVVLAVAVWWTYFDRLDDTAVRALAHRGRSRPYLIWLYIHLPLTLAVTMLGVALGLILTQYGKDGYTGVIWLLSGALTLYLLTEATICASGVGARQPTLALTWGVRSRLLAVPLVLLLPVVSRQPTWLLAGSALLVWLIALGDWYLERREHARSDVAPSQ